MPLLSSVGRIGTRALLRAQRSTVGRFAGGVGAGTLGTGRMLHRAGAGVHSTARMFYRASVGVHRGWRRIPPVVRYGGFAGAVGTYAGIRAGQGLISGWRSSFMGPEDMHNHAHRYSQLGSEKYRRNQGRMPSNHLGHQGLVQSLSRLRHG